MTPESSPFSPGRPVPVEFFIGRKAEIERLRGMVRGSARGRKTRSNSLGSPMPENAPRITAKAFDRR